MKILITIHHVLDRDDGAAGTTLSTAEGLRAAGHEVEFLSFDDLPQNLHEIAKSALFPPFVALRVIMRWLGAGGPDVVEASSGDTWILTLLPRKLRRSLICVRSHGLEHVAHLVRMREAGRGRIRLSRRYPLYHGGIRLWEVAMSLRRADVSIYMNRVDKDYAIDRLGVDAERAYLIGNPLEEELCGLDIDFSPPPKGDIRIVQIGRYSHEKGVTDGSPALDAVLAMRPGANVTFLGTGCEAARVHADFRPAVRDRVHVVPRYPWSALLNLLPGAHICLAPSLTEGWGRGVVEMMAAGLAPVVTANAGALEIVRDHIDGLVVPVGDPKAIEAALLKLIDDSEFLERFRRAAYARVQEFRLAERVDQRVRAYEQHLKPLDGRGDRRRASRR